MNYASGAARAEEVVAQVKAAGGEAIAVGGSVAKVSCTAITQGAVPSHPLYVLPCSATRLSNCSATPWLRTAKLISL